MKVRITFTLPDFIAPVFKLYEEKIQTELTRKFRNVIARTLNIDSQIEVLQEKEVRNG